MSMETRVSKFFLPQLRIINGVVVVNGISGCGSKTLIRASNLSYHVSMPSKRYEIDD